MLVAKRDPFHPRAHDIHHSAFRRWRAAGAGAAARPHHERAADVRHAAGDPARHRQRLFDVPRQFLTGNDLPEPARQHRRRCSTRASTRARGTCWCAATWSHSRRAAAASTPTRPRRSRRCSPPTQAAARRAEVKPPDQKPNEVARKVEAKPKPESEPRKAAVVEQRPAQHEALARCRVACRGARRADAARGRSGKARGVRTSGTQSLSAACRSGRTAVGTRGLFQAWAARLAAGSKLGVTPQPVPALPSAMSRVLPQPLRTQITRCRPRPFRSRSR